jgi:hypothetical protein
MALGLDRGNTARFSDGIAMKMGLRFAVKLKLGNVLQRTAVICALVVFPFLCACGFESLSARAFFGDDEARVKLGMAALAGSNPHRAKSLFETAAKNGNRRAILQMCYLSFEGVPLGEEGLPPDKEGAIYWCGLSAENGDGWGYYFSARLCVESAPDCSDGTALGLLMKAADSKECFIADDLAPFEEFFCGSPKPTRCGEFRDIRFGSASSSSPTTPSGQTEEKYGGKD